MVFDFQANAQNKNAQDILETYRNSSILGAGVFNNAGLANERKSLRERPVATKTDIVYTLQSEITHLRQELNRALEELEAHKNLREDYQHLLDQISRLHV